MSGDFVQVPRDEYERMKDDALMFQALDTMGVENWEGWREARDLVEKWKEEEDE